MKTLDRIHERYIYPRRIQILATRIASLIPPGASVLDVGCGDGLLDHFLLRLRSDITIHGIDVLIRPKTIIPVTEYDGNKIPFDSSTFDVVMFIDVLHHTMNALSLLKEAARVARKAVLVKDHSKGGFLASWTLQFMDVVGNARYGVALPHKYLSPAQWKALFAAAGLQIESELNYLGLYPFPLNLLFDRSLQCIFKLGCLHKVEC